MHPSSILGQASKFSERLAERRALQFYGAVFKADPLSLGSLASERMLAGASYQGANFQGADFAYAQLASGALDGALHAGATFERALAEGSAAARPTDASGLGAESVEWSIEEYLLLRAERLGGRIDFDQLAVQAERWRRREAEAAQLTRPAAEGVSTPAGLEPADAAGRGGASRLQAASAAIATLKAIHDQMRQTFELATPSAQTERRRTHQDGDGMTP